MERPSPAPPGPLVPIHIMDGGLGTTLKDEYNVEIDGASRPLWSSHLLISDPGKLYDVQRAFAAAGAEVIITATYQASFEGFARTQDPRTGKLGVPENDAADYMRSAVSIARDSLRGFGDRGKVALSLGAYGAIMVPSQEYTGQYDESHRTVEQLAQWHGRRLNVFNADEKVWSDVDLIAFETIPLLAEIEAARLTMDEVTSWESSTAKPFWISCVFPGEGLCLPDGSSVDVVVDAMLKKSGGVQPHAIGVNCTKITKVPALLDQFGSAVKRLVREKEISEWPALVLYPDGTKGEVYNTTTHEWETKEGSYGSSAPWEELIFNIVEETKQRFQWAAIYVGGCCKATPRMIGGLREEHGRFGVRESKLSRVEQ